MRAPVTRRSFMALLGLAAVPAKAPAAAPAPTVVELLRCPVAGLPYYSYARAADTVAVGAKLLLRREPTNPHDRRAIEVLTQQGIKLGYVPRIDNAALASLMDAGWEARAVVADCNGDAWRPVWMTVSIVQQTGA